MPFLSLFLLLAGSPLFAEKNDLYLLESASGYDLGLHLFRRHDYYDSITEFKRYIFFAPGKGKKDKALFYIGLNYLKGKEYANARGIFRELTYREDRGLAASALMASADAVFAEEKEGIKFRTDYYDPGPPPFSTDSYARYIGEFQHEIFFDNEAYLKQSALHALNLDKEKAVLYLDRYLAASPAPLEQTSGYRRLLGRIGRLSRRSETCAFLFSLILPGAGQIYAGDTGEGLVALAVNGLMIGATVYSYSRYSKTLGVILGYYGLTYYTGQLNNAVLAARRYNENRKTAFQKEIIRILF